jgi:hypothetical protein
MYTNKKTIANSPYEEALSELRAAVPSLQAIADRAFALAAANEFEGPRRSIERVGIRAVDLITAISGLAHGDRPCATSPRVQPCCDASRAWPASDHLQKPTQPVAVFPL